MVGLGVMLLEYGISVSKVLRDTLNLIVNVHHLFEVADRHQLRLRLVLVHLVTAQW